MEGATDSRLTARRCSWVRKTKNDPDPRVFDTRHQTPEATVPLYQGLITHRITPHTKKPIHLFIEMYPFFIPLLLLQFSITAVLHSERYLTPT
jgi:hypothetical protein